MITVEEALARVFSLLTPLPGETVPLAEAAGRVMLRPASAQRNQPPFAASAMDGYALPAGATRPGAEFTVIGEAGAGHAFAGTVGEGQAVRIFTGAPVPEGAGTVVIQENVTRTGERITLGDTLGSGTNIRPEGGDFRAGDIVSAPRRLRPADLGLLAAMNLAEVTVARRPVVALVATGDELVMPGETPRADQIIASNAFALKAMIESEGGVARLLPIARDNRDSLTTVFGLTEGADLVVTIGGASVGDHDIVADVAAELGLDRAFYKIAMRPGKPLMAGRMGDRVMLGLPGNPVSSIVCAYLFLLPALRALMGLGFLPPATREGLAAVPLAANGARAHYMRARLSPGEGLPSVTPFENQDSSLLSVLAQADALLLRPANDPARPVGHRLRYIPL